MKLIGTLLACCFIIAAAHAALAVMALAIFLTLLWGLYARTAQTVGYLFVCAVVWFASAQPKWALATIFLGLIIFAFRWANHIGADPSLQSDDER